MFRVERRGIEPRLPGCKPSVFPLDQRPIVNVHFCFRSALACLCGKRARLKVRPGIEPGPRPYHGRVRPKHLQTILMLQLTRARSTKLVCRGTFGSAPRHENEPGWSRTISFPGLEESIALATRVSAVEAGVAFGSTAVHGDTRWMVYLDVRFPRGPRVP